jgi:hypothetical protein
MQHPWSRPTPIPKAGHATSSFLGVDALLEEATSLTLPVVAMPGLLTKLDRVEGGSNSILQNLTYGLLPKSILGYRAEKPDQDTVTTFVFDPADPQRLVTRPVTLPPS